MTASLDLKVDWKNVPARTVTAGGVEFAYRELGTNNTDRRSQRRSPVASVGSLG